MKADSPAATANFEESLASLSLAESASSSSVSVADLRPSNLLGAFYLGFASVLTAAAVLLSLSGWTWLWLFGQLLLALALLQWFAVLHEAGHKTLFRTRSWNRWVAHLAGFAALMPADCWRVVHAKHHYWTGWQDLDITTEMVVPRPLRGWERWTINACWRLCIPLFATLYRLNNYWHLPRLWRWFPRPRERRLFVVNIVVYLVGYAALIWFVGAGELLRLVGLGMYLSFAMQDLLILSQHTHIPMTLANGESVEPYSPQQQDVFTRSLEFPEWFARLILLNFDAHGLHHMYPRAPGYELHRLRLKSANSLPWWEWAWRAKSVRGDILLFQNRDETGFLF